MACSRDQGDEDIISTGYTNRECHPDLMETQRNRGPKTSSAVVVILGGSSVLRLSECKGGSYAFFRVTKTPSYIAWDFKIRHQVPPAEPILRAKPYPLIRYIVYVSTASHSSYSPLIQKMNVHREDNIIDKPIRNYSTAVKP